MHNWFLKAEAPCPCWCFANASKVWQMVLSQYIFGTARQSLGADGNPRLVKTCAESLIKECLGSWTMHPPVVVTGSRHSMEYSALAFLRGKHNMVLLQQLNAEGEPSSIKGSQDFTKELYSNLRCTMPTLDMGSWVWGERQERQIRVLGIPCAKHQSSH